MLIPPKILKVAKCAALDNSRYAIRGVQIERHPIMGCVAAATDGRRLIEARWQEPDLEHFPPIDGMSNERLEAFKSIVPLETFKELGKLAPKGGAVRCKPILNNLLLDEKNANGTVKVGSTNQEASRSITYKPHEGVFPKYVEIFPDYRPGVNAVEIGFNPALLAETLETVGDIAGRENLMGVGVRLLVPVNGVQPIQINSEWEGTKARALVMPINLDADERKGDRKRSGPRTLLESATDLYSVMERLCHFREEWGPVSGQTDATMSGYEKNMEELLAEGFDILKRIIDPKFQTLAEFHESVEAQFAAKEAAEDATSQPPAPNSPAGVMKRLADEEAAEKIAPEPVAQEEPPAAEPKPKKDRRRKSIKPVDKLFQRRVRVKALRDDADKHAPGSGCRCRSCGANAHRAIYNPKDTWLVLNGYAFCPTCEPFAEGAQ